MSCQTICDGCGKVKPDCQPEGDPCPETGWSYMELHTHTGGPDEADYCPDCTEKIRSGVWRT